MARDQQLRLLNRSVSECGFSTRTVSKLRENGIFVIRTLLQYSESELFNFRGIGKKGITEIKAFLSAFDLHLYGKETVNPDKKEPWRIFYER